MSLSDGTRLGSYEIAGKIGAGGMGEVYRATDTKLGRDVAIKTLPASLANDTDRLARFEREAKLLATLNHAHIASVYSLDEQDGTVYIAMELVDGETLEEKLKTGALPIDDALQYALQIALALEAAHDKGVVHRDLKPANVMITLDGVVKVLDFGLAKAFSGDPNEASPAHSPALSLAMTQAGLVLGTAGYMSPEQASGQATDQRADIWSFGVVVYEMLTGQPLFHGESVPHILADVLRADPDWDRLPKGLHPRIRLMLERCLAKKPRERYHSIADARGDIDAALNDPSAAAVSEMFGGQAVAGVAIESAPVWRRTVPWVAALVLAAIAGITAWTARAPAPGPVIAVVHPVPPDIGLMNTISGSLAISPAGEQFVYNMTDALYLSRRDEFEPRILAGLELLRAAPVFSPDGESIAMIMGGATGSQIAGASFSRFALVSVPVDGGAPTMIAPFDSVQAGDAWGLRWEADGTIVYAAPEGIWRVSASGGTPELVIDESVRMVTTPDILPGGEWLLYTVGSVNAWDTAQIVVESLVTGERRVLHTGGSHARYVPTGHLTYLFGNVLYAVPFDVEALEITGRPVQIVQGIRRSPLSGIGQYDFSDDGTLVYQPGVLNFVASVALAVVDLNRAIRPYPMPPGDYAFPRISPDGRWAAFTARYQDGDDIAVYELGTETPPRRLTFGGTSRYPLWSADSTRVVFQSSQDGTASLYAQRADGSEGQPVQLTMAAEGESHIADSMSPDGAVMSYTVESETGSSIWILDFESNEAEPLFSRTGVAFSQSVFSPNGNWIAYQSTETGEDEVFVQPYPPTGSQFQLPHTLENHHPLWSPDGTELFYFPGPNRFESVRITTEPGFSFSTATAYPSPPMNDGPAIRRRYDVMPDGSGFLGFVSNDQDGADGFDSLHIVYNWFEELKARVPAE